MLDALPVLLINTVPMLMRASIFIATDADIVKEGCLPFHAQCNGEGPNMLLLLEEDDDAVLLGFDDVECQLV